MGYRHDDILVNISVKRDEYDELMKRCGDLLAENVSDYYNMGVMDESQKIHYTRRKVNGGRKKIRSNVALCGQHCGVVLDAIGKNVEVCGRCLRFAGVGETKR